MSVNKNAPLQETISVFKEAELEPEVQHGKKHVKVRVEKQGRSLLATARPAH